MLEKNQRSPYSQKNDKQSIKNYGPVSLLPICQNQSSFKPSDSCLNQLLSITHEICKSFDVGWEVKGVFPDISKAFDKVWHEGLLLKLKLNGISGNFLKIMDDVLANRYQRVLLNGQVSKWAAINAGVPQGSILGPLLFLICINDLSMNHHQAKTFCRWHFFIFGCSGYKFIN